MEDLGGNHLVMVTVAVVVAVVRMRWRLLMLSQDNSCKLLLGPVDLEDLAAEVVLLVEVTVVMAVLRLLDLLQFLVVLVALAVLGCRHSVLVDLEVVSLAALISWIHGVVALVVRRQLTPMAVVAVVVRGRMVWEVLLLRGTPAI